MKKKVMKKNLLYGFALVLIGICTIPSVVNGDTVKKDVYITPFDPIEHYEDIGQSRDDIQAYKKDIDMAIEEMSEIKLDDIRATITFKIPIEESALKQMAEKYNLDIEVIELRHNVRGERYTSAIAFDGDWDSLNSTIDSINNELEEEHMGIIDIYANVDSCMLEDINSDPRIYLVDVSGDAATLGSEVVNGNARNEDRFDDGIDDYPKSLSWELEDLRTEAGEGVLSEMQ